MNKLSRESATRIAKRLLRLCAWLLGSALILLAAAFAVFTWGILPRLDNYRPDLERLLSENTGYKVQIQSMTGRWDGLAPELTISGLRLSADAQSPAMTLQRVILKPSWLSLTAWEPRFALVRVEAPSLALLRDKQQRLYLNGLLLSGGKQKSDGKLDDWLLRQHEFVIDRVQIRWQDDYAGVAPMTLQNGSLRLTRGLLSHRLQLSADTVGGFASGLSFDTNWSGDDVQRWQEWSGDINLSLKSFRTGDWTHYLSQWVDWRQGSGNGTLNLAYKKASITSLQGNWQLHGLDFTAQNAGPLHLPLFGGELSAERHGKDEWRVSGKAVDLATDSGSILNKAALSARYQPDKDGGGELKLDRINLSPLQPLLTALGGQNNAQINRWQPQGTLSDLKASWRGALAAPKTYNAAAQFSQLGWDSVDGIPGMSGISGQVKLNEKTGTLTLNSTSSALSMPNLFNAALPLDSLIGQIDWTLDGKATQVKIKSLRFTNRDLAAQLTGQYNNPGQGSGNIDLAGRLERVDATSVPRYLPHIMNHNTLSWLNNAFKGGRVSTASLLLRGDLNQFPFKGGKGGQFKIDAHLDNVDLLYGPAWPRIDNISGRMQFINESMIIDADSGVTLGVPLNNVNVTIPDLDSHEPILIATGKASAPLPNLLNFAAKNPTSPMLADFTGQLKGKGNARLGIRLDVPLNHSRDTKVSGDLLLSGNELVFNKLPVPAQTQIDGALHFTEQGVTARGIKLSTLGGRFSLNAMLDPKQRFEIEGDADSHAVVKQYVNVLSPFVSGRSHYKIQFTVSKDLDDLKVESTLTGTQLNAPSPARKSASESWPLLLSLRPGGGGWALNYTLGQRSQGTLTMKKDGSLVNGVIGAGNVSQTPPPRALAIRVVVPAVDLTPWIAIFSGDGAGGKTSGSLTTPLQIELASDKVSVYGRELNAVKVALHNNIAAHSWAGALESHEISGEYEYFTANGGLLKARLPKFDLALSKVGLTKTGAIPNTAGKGASLTSADLPALDVTIDRLRYKGSELGRLIFTARINGEQWQLPSLRLVNADGTLQASLTSYRGASPRVDSEFNIDSSNIGGLLDRFGYKGAIVDGKGKLSGKLGWPGRLLDFKEEHLSGHLKLDASDGRFAKLEPGAARLLGVLSLQSLVRRAKLDFSDVFGSGFAFDQISGGAQVASGVFSSDDLSMSGPSADVALKGSVDLAKNSQHLRVRVVPHLSGSVALTAGAATLNPLVGLAALAAQKVMRDPLDKMMALEYEITGTFDNPVVKKQGMGRNLNNGAPQDSSEPAREKTR